jgi:iron complex outermembrane receptor protein
MKFLFCLVVLAPTFAFASYDLPVVEVMHKEEQGKIDVSNISMARHGSDVASLLKGTPGISLRTGGGLSSQPAIRGLSNDRVLIRIDDVEMTSACPNHMNSALTYIDPSKIETIEVFAGITPVSEGGDSLGGAILVESKRPVFGVKGRLHKNLNATSYYKSNNENIGASLGVGVANENLSFQYEGMDESANRYRNGDWERLKGTIFSQNNQSVTFASKISEGVLALKLSRSIVPYQGFVNQYMDLNDNKAESGNLSYVGVLQEVLLETNISFQHTDHYMNKLSSERSGQMPMYTSSDQLGYNLKLTHSLDSVHTVKAGGEYNQYRLEDWWSPVSGMGGMSPGTFRSIHQGQRDRLGLFIENNSQWKDNFKSLIGLRTDIVDMDTGDVKGYNTTNNLPADAAAFNSKNRSVKDKNWDAVLSGEYTFSKKAALELGYARKTRSPNLYERYAWAGTITRSNPARMDMRMINWFGDGNGYVGDINLNPEISHKISTNLKLNGARKNWSASISPYANYIEDFIDADFLEKSNNINYLRFANHDAVLMGVDLSGHVDIGELKLRAMSSYVRGYRKDGKEDLYHMMPLHGKLILEQNTDKWSHQFVLHLVSEKKQVNTMRLEPETPGYAIVDLATSYQITKQARVELAVTNLLNKSYLLPLGGIDVVNFPANSQTALSGMGRSFNTALKLNF